MGRFDKYKTEEEMIIQQIGLELLTRDGDKFNFRCPICGDSKKEKSKKRGYFIFKNSKYTFKCHNCGKSYSSLSYFLKENFPLDYTRHYFDNHDPDFKYVAPPIIPPKKVRKDKIDKHFDDLLKHGNIIPCSDFKLDGDSDELEIRGHKLMTAFLEERQIPKDRIKELYIAFNYYVDIFAIYKTMTDDDKKFANIAEDVRIFWKIENTDKKTIGFAGRSLEDNPYLRYMFSSIDEGVDLISNINDIDITKPVYVTEGFFDSMFLDNCVALNGVTTWKRKIKKLKEIGIKEVIIVLDNEDGMDEYHRQISSYYWGDDFIVRAVKFDKELRSDGKDVNEYVLKGFDLNKIVYSRVVKDYFDFFEDCVRFKRVKSKTKVEKIIEKVEEVIVEKIENIAEVVKRKFNASKEWVEQMWSEAIVEESVAIEQKYIDNREVSVTEFEEYSNSNALKFKEDVGFVKKKFRGRWRRK